MSGNAVVVWSSVLGGSAYVIVSGAAGAVNTAYTNSTVVSDLGNPAATDQPTGASIAGVWWSTGTAGSTIIIKRGANVVLTLSGSGHFARDSGWPGISLFSSANLVVTPADANATCTILLSKEYVGGSPGQ